MPPPSRPLPLAIWRNRSLLLQLCRRDIAERYRGSSAGILWSLVTPLVMLTIYSFVFSVVFKARWGTASVTTVDYSLLLFAGLLVFTIFSECVNRAPTLIATKPSFVKKVVFPLELLPVVALGTALFHFAAGMAVLLAFCLFANGSIPWTVVLAPLVLVPLVLLTLGLSWLLSSVGVFVHDLRHATPFVTTGMLFLSPIFYPAAAVPDAYRFLMVANPITAPVENMRLVLIAGRLPDWLELASGVLVNGLVAAVCYLWFQRARPAFADVV